MNQPLFFQWGVSTLFGWGIYGLNLLRHWPRAAGAPAYCLSQIHLQSLGGIDPLTFRAIAQPLVDSDRMRLSLEADARAHLKVDGVALLSLGNRFTGAPLPRAGGMTGRATCGTIFFEDTNLPDAADIARDFSLIIAGCAWSEDVLRANGVDNVATVVQGIDPSQFHPAPRAGALEGRFAVFSGGKLEHRKAQDIVLLAFRAFAQRHPDAVLVTAWHCPWPASAVTINRNPDIVPVEFGPDGKVDMAAWARANGLGDHQFIDLGSIPNHLMGRVVREMDVALFPNRCEGGTNLVAMECMACGVPVILSDNTGHKDLVALDAAYSLRRQGPVVTPGLGTEGWGESDVEEILESLEQVYTRREEARRLGLKGAEAMAQWSWRRQIGLLHDTIRPYCG